MRILRRATGRVADCHCWIVGVWYRNGRSVLLGETRERDNARTELEHIDMDGGAAKKQRVVKSTADVNDTMMQPAVQVPNLLGSPRLSGGPSSTYRIRKFSTTIESWSTLQVHSGQKP